VNSRARDGGKRAKAQRSTAKAAQPNTVPPLSVAPQPVNPLPVAQGWKQFLTSRKKMLSAYDRAKETAKAHEVETHQGVVAEAQFRKWLSDFLPSTCRPIATEMPHRVIGYNASRRALETGDGVANTANDYAPSLMCVDFHPRALGHAR
jgi:hypothetical protein